MFSCGSIVLFGSKGKLPKNVQKSFDAINVFPGWIMTTIGVVTIFTSFQYIYWLIR